MDEDNCPKCGETLRSLKLRGEAHLVVDTEDRVQEGWFTSTRYGRKACTSCGYTFDSVLNDYDIELAEGVLDDLFDSLDDG